MTYVAKCLRGSREVNSRIYKLYIFLFLRNIVGAHIAGDRKERNWELSNEDLILECAIFQKVQELVDQQRRSCLNSPQAAS